MGIHQMSEYMNNEDDMEYYPAALTIAGSDSSGGAGIQADLRTFAAFGVYGCSAITAVTAQNPLAVTRVDALSNDAVAAQIQAITDTIEIRAAKTGMLCNAEIINAIVENLSEINFPLVIDPVMVATSGSELLAADAIDSLKNNLLKLATWITPNIPEAEILTDIKINNQADMAKAAMFCANKWNCSCIVKAGHLKEPSNGMATDIVATNGNIYQLSAPLIENCQATHGTGCTLSAALVSALALGFHWKQALKMAKSFVLGSLAEAVPLSPTIEAMYPPGDSYLEKVTLKAL
jgi:hydroxymethylpyrimidine/phosphomethylpyrimidine kinase